MQHGGDGEEAPSGPGDADTGGTPPPRRAPPPRDDVDVERLQFAKDDVQALTRDARRVADATSALSSVLVPDANGTTKLMQMMPKIPSVAPSITFADYVADLRAEPPRDMLVDVDVDAKPGITYHI